MANKIPCPVCGIFRFQEESDFDICPECGWENDGVQMSDCNYWGGANELSVNESKLQFKLLQNKAISETLDILEQEHRDTLAAIYEKYKGIDYRIDGDKIQAELKKEHDRYVEILQKLSLT